MKGWKIFWGLAFIAVAVLLILNALGVLTPISSMFGEISFWQILGGLMLVCAIVSTVGTGEIGGAFVLLGFLFMIFERNIAFVFFKGGNEDIINNWLVFGCSLLLAAGFSLLKPRRKKKKFSHVVVNKKDNNLSSSEVYIDCATFEEEYVENNLGALDVRFDNVDEFRGGTLHVKNSLGAIEIYVPKSWRIDCSISNSLGSVEVEDAEGGDKDSPVLTVAGSNNLGSIDIERV